MWHVSRITSFEIRYTRDPSGSQWVFSVLELGSCSPKQMGQALIRAAADAERTGELRVSTPRLHVADVQVTGGADVTGVRVSNSPAQSRGCC